MDKIMFFDYLDKKGNLKEIVCEGHVNFNLFSDEAFRLFKKRPFKMRTIFRVFRKIGTKKVNGRKVGGYNTYIECDERTPRAEPVTVGYYQ